MKKIILTSFACLLCFVNLKAQYANDQCSGAVSLTLGSGDVCTAGTFTTNTTTNDPTTAPSCWSYSNTDGVWYKFTATATNAFVEVNDAGVTYTPMIAVYNGGAAPGTCPGAAATPIAGGCLDYSVNSTTLSLSSLTVGNTYYIMLDMPSTISQNFCINVYNAPPLVTAGTSCPASANSTVALTTCDDIGTGTLETNGGVTTFTQAGGTAPTPAPSCGSVTAGSWVHYDLAAGVTSITMNWESEFGGSAANGSHSVNAAFYQGASCASLTQVTCETMGTFNAGAFTVNNLVVQGLDPSQDLWMYVYDDANKSFTLPYDIVGSATPANDDCSSPSPATSSITGCNLGAVGDEGWNAVPGSTLYGPGNVGATCDGGTYYTNENTVWYTFTAQTTTASLSVSNVTCNEYGSGIAQFAMFSSCACPTISNYDNNACFLGCGAGTGTISMTGLTAGQTLYLAFDGTAGDVCKLDFTLTNLVPLPVAWLDIYTKKTGRNEVTLFWSTEMERNADRYDIERSDDGAETFYSVGTVKAAGNTDEMRKYKFTDSKPNTEKTYYRIKQVDLDGEASYSKILFVDFSLNPEEPVIYYNEYTKQIDISFDKKFTGEYEVNLLNVMGKPVDNSYHFTINESADRSIYAGDLPPGVYIVSLNNLDNPYKFVKKIVIP